MSTIFEERSYGEFGGAGGQRQRNVSPGFRASQNLQYDKNYYSTNRAADYGADISASEPSRRHPIQKRRALDKLGDLRPLVDRIINECTIESKEVKTGLQAIRDYQTNVLDELRYIVEEEEDYGVRESSVQGYYVNQEEAYGLREQKQVLRNQLDGEVRAANRLADDYRSLEGDYAKLKSEVDKLKRKNRFDGEIVEKKRYRQDLGRTRPTQEIPRSRFRHPDEFIQVRRSQSEDIYEENARLKQQLSDALTTIDTLNAINKDLERKLQNAEDELDRLQKVGKMKSPEKTQHLKDEIVRLSAELRKAQDNLKGGDLHRQLAELKHHNEQLRVETIRLLKIKSGGGSSDVQQVRDLQNEIMNLHDSIEKENNAKVKFIQEMDDYKRKFNSLESENRQLKASLGGQDRLNSYPIQSYEAPKDYYPSSGAIYSEMTDVLDYNRYGQDDKLNKYKGFLDEVRNFKSYV